ncbi:hypothetical protein KUTeg_021838, partial [Tegillarca granosa]
MVHIYNHQRCRSGFSVCMPIVRAFYNHTLEKELRKLIFTTNEYDRFILPDSLVVVNVSVELQTMKKLIWYDSRFNWSGNPTYSTIRIISSNSENIWVPKIAQLLMIRISSSRYSSTDMYFGPWTCELALVLHDYSNEEVALVFHSPDVSKISFSENGEWEFMASHTVTDDLRFYGVTITKLKFMLKFRRRPLFQFLNSLLPITMLSVLISLIFKLPAESGEKIGFCVTVLLAFAVYVTIASNHIPTTSVSTSYLCKYKVNITVYLILILAFGIVSSFVTIFVLYCHNVSGEELVPNWLLKLASHVLIPFSCTKKCSCFNRNCCNRKRKINCQQKDKKLQNPEPEISWKELGRIVDSFSFKASILINFVM